MDAHNAEYWRSRAEEARAVAAQMTDAHTKAVMLTIAQVTKSWPSGPSNALVGTRFKVPFDTAGKVVANEKKYPFIVEVPVAVDGLDVELNRQIVGFHRSRRIPPRHGRTIWRDEQRYYRWCFSDLEAARAFIEQFGGAFYKTTGA